MTFNYDNIIMTSKQNINCPVGKHYEEKCGVKPPPVSPIWGGGVKGGVDACFTYIVKYRHLAMY